jgi:hypothetical protein
MATFERSGMGLLRPKAVPCLGTLAVALLLLPSGIAAAASERLDCNLTQIETKAGPNFDVETESRTIAVVVNDEARTIVVYQDGRGRALDHVTITPIAMNGYVDDMSLGIQTSSGNVVLQSYGPNSTKAEFGICSESSKPMP